MPHRIIGHADRTCLTIAVDLLHGPPDLETLLLRELRAERCAVRVRRAWEVDQQKVDVVEAEVLEAAGELVLGRWWIRSGLGMGLAWLEGELVRGPGARGGAGSFLAFWSSSSSFALCPGWGFV